MAILHTCTDMHQFLFDNNRQLISIEIENMYHVCIELYKHEWKFGRMRNAVGTRAAGECFHSFFEFSQTFTSVCITQ